MEQNENKIEITGETPYGAEENSSKLQKKDALEDLSALFDNIDLESNEMNQGLTLFAGLLAMDDESFKVIGDVFLDEFEKAAQDPAAINQLIKEMQQAGITTEQFRVLLEKYEDPEFLKGLEGELSVVKIDWLKRLIAIVTNVLTRGVMGILIPIELCHEKAKMPTYAHDTDSGMDIYALEDITILPGETKLVSTGLKVALPPEYELQVRPKSGRALKTKLRIANTPGTIDSGYREEIKVIVENVESPIKDITYHLDDSEIEEGKSPTIIVDSILHGSPYYIGEGEKFAQLVLMKVPKAAFFKVDDVNHYENDGRNGGFGSTGIK